MVSPAIQELHGVSDDSATDLNVAWYKQTSFGGLTRSALGGSAGSSHPVAESACVLVELYTY